MSDLIFLLLEYNGEWDEVIPCLPSVGYAWIGRGNWRIILNGYYLEYAFWEHIKEEPDQDFRKLSWINDDWVEVSRMGI